MARLFFLACCLGFAFPAPAQLASVESIPVDHKEPITIRVFDGKNGLPMPNVRMVLLAGYTESDINRRFWREEAITDAYGEARVPRPLVNFPFLEAVVVRAKLCQAIPNGEIYKIGRIRNQGWSAPNHCGAVLSEDEPGVLNLFAKRGRAPAVDEASKSSGAEDTLDFQPLSPPPTLVKPAPPNSGQRPSRDLNEIQSLLAHDPS